MIRELNTFEDFKNEKSRVAKEIARHGHMQNIIYSSISS